MTVATGRGHGWRAREPEHNTYCPECTEPVYRKSSFRGKIRFGHRSKQKLDCGWHGTDAIGAELEVMCGVPKARSEELKREIIASRGKKMIYVITAAQNATPIHGNGFQSLLTYCKHTGAKLLVVPYRYKNPTSTWSKKAQQDDWWTAEVLPYLISARVYLNKHLILLADIMTQPTAARPLEGFETITGPQSGIIGHPKLELTTVPTPQEKLPKILTTTGAITKKNYIPSKAGKKGEHHHTFGACVVEIEGGHFHIRQINMTRDGAFCDLLHEYNGKSVTRYRRVPALVMGDTHVEVIDPSVVKATFTAPDSMVKFLRPENLVWHDVHDGTAKNHHERGRAFHDYVRHKDGRSNVEAELRRTFAFIDQVTPADARNIVVPSNHTEWLREWVENTDPRRDPENVMFWAETYLAIIRSKNTGWTPSGVAVQDAFAYWGGKLLKTAGQTTFLRRDQPHQIRGIEVSYHGDRFSGGKKGSRESFGKIGVKSIIGHTHAPGIMDGAYQVGTSSRLDLTYASGQPSAWLHTHAVIYPNGKRSLINIIDGEWKLSR
jgi:hypothetical protein